jgi:hypothetical protein
VQLARSSQSASHGKTGKYQMDNLEYKMNSRYMLKQIPEFTEMAKKPVFVERFALVIAIQ